MSVRPCYCNRFVRNEPWIQGRDCRLCWLWFHKPTYKKLWNEQPSLFRRAWNYLKALWKHWWTGRPITKAGLMAERKAICQGCIGPGGYYDDKRDLCTHKRCGCMISHKAAWETERCPLKKWPK